MPEATNITTFDVMGLLVIMLGLVGYRAGPDLAKKFGLCVADENEGGLLEDDELKKDLDEPLMQTPAASGA